MSTPILCEVCHAAPISGEVRPHGRPGDREPRWWKTCGPCGEEVYNGRLDPRDAAPDGRGGTGQDVARKEAGR